MSSPAPVRTRYSIVLPIASGALIAVAGIFALYGWHSNHLVLARVGPGLPQMHYIAAVCFVLTGIAVAFSSFRNRSAALVPPAALVLLVVIDTLGRVVGIPVDFAAMFGLDAVNSNQVHLTTIGSITFLLIGLALIGRWSTRRHGPIISGTFGAFSLSCGLAALLGFLAGYTDSLKWAVISEISLQGAAGFLLAGLIIIIRSRYRDSSLKLTWQHYIPVTLLITCLTTSFLARQHIRVREVEAADQAISAELLNLQRTIESDVSQMLIANKRMAERWSDDSDPKRDKWEKDAWRYYRDFGGYQAIEWVDKSYHVRWIVPLENNEKALGQDLAAEPRRLAALLNARDSRKTTVSAPVHLAQGGTGILAYTPIFKGNEFKGFIHGVFRADALFEKAIPSAALEEYAIAIDYNNVDFFTTDESLSDAGSVLDQSGKLVLGGTTFRLRIRPNHEKLAFLSAQRDEIALLLGTLISLLLTGSVLLAQRARRNNAVTARANSALKSEIESRKHVETMLRETSTFRKAILNGANCMIISTDRNGMITSFNRNAENLLGYTANEVIGHFCLDHFHLEEEIAQYNSELAKRFGYQSDPGFESLVVRARDRIADEREWTYSHKNGSTFPVALSVTALEDEFSQITGYLAIGRDNSQLYNTSQQLKESEERFKAVVNNTPALVYIKDKEGRFIFSNNKFEALLQLEPGVLIGKTVFDLTDERTARNVSEIEQRVLATGIPEESSELVLLGDEPLAHYLFLRFTFPSITRERCLGVIAIDLSPQLTVEEELRAANRAAVESSRMKSEFLAKMSHEIRTPMNGVLGMLEVLLETSLNASQREYAEVVQESARSLLTIIDDILDFSRLEAGKLSFESIEFDLLSTVENTVALFAEAADESGIEISTVIAPDAPVELLGDPGRFRQVLTNLIGNAVKFTEEGFVTVSISKDTESGNKATLRIEVEDTGIGITESARKDLFEPFMQADGSMVRKYGGTGLGLSISKQLVELMNGEIGVESEPGVGSKFTFTADFGIQERLEANIPQLDPDAVKILVTDDLKTNRKSISYQLQGLGMQTLEASNGDQCIEQLILHSDTDKPFDIVILDLDMPGMNGFETAQRIKHIPEIENTKIVIMPSQGKRGHAHKAIKSGISAYLPKPIRQVELFDCVTTLMVGRNSSPGSNLEDQNRLITRHSLMENRSDTGLPILVATSNVRNQGILSMQLELLGYRSELVTDGFEVIEAVKRRTYALIIMDADLPRLDGFNAAEQIRNHLMEETVPIVGISSGAGKADKKAALEVGMDDYQAFPMSEELLSSTIKQLLNREAPVRKEPVTEDAQPRANGETASGDPAMEDFVKNLLEEIGPDMAEMTFSLFAEDASRHMTDIKALAKDGRFGELENLTDSMMLVCDTIAAVQMQDRCLELKRYAARKDLDGVSNAAGVLENVFDSAINHLESLSLESTVG